VEIFSGFFVGDFSWGSKGKIFGNFSSWILQMEKLIGNSRRFSLLGLQVEASSEKSKKVPMIFSP
jgi:hypothetical protein